jgi:7,8-dihydroneopterin aldolase/epimerase/oxygenase
MAGHFYIELKGLRFFAEHGLYKEEVLIGNEFEVDVVVECQAPAETITKMEQTVNYVAIYQIIKEEFEIRKQLLETCAMQIANKIEQQFHELENIDITIRKLNPPITNFTGSVAVRYVRELTSRAPAPKDIQ